MHPSGVHAPQAEGLTVVRSLLFVPGDSDRKMSKASGCGADVIILDLEDSVAPDRKGQARQTTADYVAGASQSAPTLCVRINALDTGHWEQDLRAIANAPPALILLPKAREGADVVKLAKALTAHGMPDTKLITLITEVPASLLRLDTYLNPPASLTAMTWGAEDLSVELGAQANRDAAGYFTSPYMMARNLALVTAAAAGVTAIDTVFTNFRDMEGLKREATEAARDGFTGKLAIHPAQVETINAAFTPTPEQTARAQAIISAFHEAGPGTGVVNLDGEMIDEPHRRQAENLLARASMYAKPSG